MKESYKKNFIRAGALAKEVRAFGRSLIQKGASYNEILLQVQQKIIELGAIAAFPPQIALNEVAAHFLTQPGEDIILTDQLVKLDVGICVEGAVGDCAVTVDLSGQAQHIINAAETALLEAEKIIRVGLPIREIGSVIEQAILSFGLQPVRNLCGHGLGFFKVHTPPLIPNYEDRSKGVIQPNMTFAIEPFASSGVGLIREEGVSTLFSLVKDKSSLKSSALVDCMRTFRGLPFSLHDLLKQGLVLEEIQAELDILIDKGIVGSYPPLVEDKGVLIAQAENSILIDANGTVFVTTR